MICGSGGSKNWIAKAAGAEPSGEMRDEKLHAVVARSTFRSQKCKKLDGLRPLLEVEMTKKCTPLWREAHVEVNIHKAPHVRSTFRSWDVKKVHACRCGAKHIIKSKCTKHTRFGAILEVEMSNKCTPLWRKAHVQVKMLKAPHARTTFERSDVVSRGRRKGLCTLSKVSKTWGFRRMPKNDGRSGLKRICKDAFSPAGAVQERCSSEMLGGPGADFLREVAFWTIRSSGWLRWFCVTGAALRMTWPHFIVAGAAALYTDGVEKIAKRIGTRQSALHFLNEVLQNSVASDVVNFGFLRKSHKSRRIASILRLSNPKIEEASQNCCVFKLADRQIDR